MYLTVGVSRLHGFSLKFQKKKITSIALQTKLVSSEKQNVLSSSDSLKLNQLHPS